VPGKNGMPVRPYSHSQFVGFRPQSFAQCVELSKIEHYILEIKTELLFKALFTRDNLTHNIAIKRYCDKKIFLRHRLLLAKVSS